MILGCLGPGIVPIGKHDSHHHPCMIPHCIFLFYRTQIDTETNTINVMFELTICIYAFKTISYIGISYTNISITQTFCWHDAMRYVTGSGCDSCCTIRAHNTAALTLFILIVANRAWPAGFPIYVRAPRTLN